MQPVAYYDPTAEATNAEQSAAARWECLRRNLKFRAVAAEWVKSKAFREQHVLTEDYYHQAVHAQRCALDWMISPSERLDLAKYQIARRHWFLDQRFNFGPITSRLLFPREQIPGEKVLDAFEVNILTDAPDPLNVNQSWPETSQLFKQQFRIATLDHRELQNITAMVCDKANLVRRIAIYVAAGDPHNEKLVMARDLTVFGDRLYDLGEFHTVFAFPRNVTPKGLREMFVLVKRTLEESGQLKQAGRYNRRRSFLGTSKEWHWFLEAESRGMDPSKSSDLYQLADLYSAEIKATPPGSRRRDVKIVGFKGEKVSSQQLRNRRASMRKCIGNIQKWIDWTYPPKRGLPDGKSA